MIGMHFADRMAERFGGGSIQAGDDAAGDAADSAELSGGGNDQRVSLASGVSFETQALMMFAIAMAGVVLWHVKIRSPRRPLAAHEVMAPASADHSVMSSVWHRARGYDAI